MRFRLPVLAAVLAFLAVAAAPAVAGSHLEHKFKLEPGGKFVLDSVAGSVTLTGVSGSGVTIVITADDDLESKIDFKFEENPGEVRVIAKKKADVTAWLTGLHLHNFHYEIQVPTRTAVDLKTGGGRIAMSAIEGDAVVTTSGGAIEVTDLQGNLKGRTSGGHIDLKNIRGSADIETSGGGIEIDGVTGSLEAETSGGHIRVSRAGADVKLETSGGGITVDDAVGKVDAQTSGGPIDVSFAPGNSKGGNLETSGGGIRVKIDPKANLRVDAETSGGSVVADVPITVVGTLHRSAVTGTMNGGGETLRLRSSGGSIRIAPRG